MTGGRIRIEDTSPRALDAVLSKLREAGAAIVHCSGSQMPPSSASSGPGGGSRTPLVACSCRSWSAWSPIAAKLRLHGIEVETLTEPATVQAELHHVVSFQVGSDPVSQRLVVE